MKSIYRGAMAKIALLLCFVSNAGFGQETKLRNAYEIARAMYAAKNFDTSQKGLVHEKLMSALVWYTEADSFENLEIMTRNHSLLNNYIVKTAGYFFRVDSLFYLPKDVIQTRLRNLHLENSNLVKIMDDFEKKSKLVSELYTELRALRSSVDSARLVKGGLAKQVYDLKTEIQGLKSLSPEVDTINISGSLTVLTARIKMKEEQLTARQDLVAQITTIEESKYEEQQKIYKRLENAKAERQVIKHTAQQEIAKGEYQRYRELYLDKNFNPQVLNDMYNPSVFKSNSLEFASAASGLDQQVHIQIAGQTASAGGFRMPSESEMIDAVAIYLAKRVKQEAVLWFFDAIKKTAETDELMNICFPESIQMLKSGDMFTVPNFGTSWKYAMSKDFITLPEHIFTSGWLARNVPAEYQSTLNDMRLALTISRLFQQNYNYYEMIRYLYLNNDGMKNRSAAKNLITMLYSINQEMVNSVSDSSSHLLTFEELNSMPPEAFILMMQLMDVKYGGVYTDIFGDIGSLSEKDYRKRFIQYIGRIQLSSQKIDQAKGQFRQMIKDGKETSGANYTYLSPWKFVGELFQVLQPDSSLVDMGAIEADNFNLSIRYLIKTQEVFENLEQKNYTGAVKLTIDIVDSLRNLKSPNRTESTGMMRVYDQLTSQYGPGSTLFDTTATSFRVPTYWATEWKKLYRLSKSAIAAIKSDVSLYKFLTGNEGDEYGNNNGDPILARDEYGSIYSPADNPVVRLGSRSVTLPLKNKESLPPKDMMYLMVKTLVIDSLEWDTKSRERAEKFVNFYTTGNYAKSKDIILRLAGFLNDVALSGNSKQLSEIIESYSLPSGSYKRKRASWYSVDLNAFVGVYAGYEYPVNSTKPAGGVYGITAPIGISYTKQLGRRVTTKNIRQGGNYKCSYNNMYRRTKSTITFGLSIVDLGAVVSYRFTNMDSTLPQQFKWEQFVSPGLHISYGIPGTPLVWDFGAVYTPRIRKFADAASGDKQYNTFRVQTGLLFDLPLLNMWERKSIVRTRKYSRAQLDKTK